MSDILIGNSFPLSLIGRKVTMEPIAIGEIIARLTAADAICSFWGHRNTLAAAQRKLGFDLTPAQERPALMLDADKFPQLDGKTFRECLILSAECRPGFRPEVGKEVGEDEITGWHGLIIKWE